MCIRTAPRFTPRAGATHKTEGTSASMNCGPLCLRDWNKLVPYLEILGIWDYISTKQNLFYFLGNCWNVHECQWCYFNGVLEENAINGWLQNLQQCDRNLGYTLRVFSIALLCFAIGLVIWLFWGLGGWQSHPQNHLQTGRNRDVQCFNHYLC